MNLRLSFLLGSASVLLVSPFSSSANEAGKKLLAEIMDKPGSWSQMCGMPPPVAFDAPVPVFSGSLVWRHFNMGGKETHRLQAARAEVLPELVEALQAMDLTKPPKETRGAEHGDFSAMRSGLKLNWLNSVHLQIICDLNAVETLPELLRLEEQLYGLLDAAQKDVKAPLPPLDLDSPAGFVKPGDRGRKRPDKFWESAEYKRDVATFNCRVIQRELLGTITLLLQREEWPGIKDRFAAERKKAVEKELAERQEMLAKARKSLVEEEAKGGEAAENARRWFKECEDSVAFLRGGIAEVQFTAEYTPALRGEIRSMTGTFLKSVPPEKRRGAAAMPKHEETK